MKVVIYDYDKMVRAGKLLNAIRLCGVDQARIVAELGDILDAGKTGDMPDQGESSKGKSEGGD